MALCGRHDRTCSEIRSGFSSWIVAEHQGVRLRAVQQTQSHAGVGRMKERALPFDDIPMIGRVRGRKGLRRSGDEIRDHGVDGDTMILRSGCRSAPWRESQP